MRRRCAAVQGAAIELLGCGHRIRTSAGLVGLGRCRGGNIAAIDLIPCLGFDLGGTVFHVSAIDELSLTKNCTETDLTLVEATFDQSGLALLEDPLLTIDLAL